MKGKGRTRLGKPRNRRRERLSLRLPRPAELVSLGARAARRNLRPLLATSLAAALAGGAALVHDWLTSSPRFAISRIQVGPLEHLPESSLEKRLAVGPRANIFRYDTDAAERRLEESPWVARARIRRDLPDSLEVSIEERRPAAMAIAGGIYLVDDGGVLFKRATLDEAVALELVAVSGIGRETFARDPAAARRLLQKALAIAAAWAEGDRRPALGEIHLDPLRGVTLITRERAIEIRAGAGDASDFEARLAVFDRVWASLQGEERAGVERIVLDTSPTPRRAAVAFATEDETATWLN